MQDAAEYEDWWFEDDVGSSNSGYYILQVGIQFSWIFLLQFIIWENGRNFFLQGLIEHSSGSSDTQGKVEQFWSLCGLGQVHSSDETPNETKS